MRSTAPVIRRIAWGSVIPQLFFMGLLVFGYYLIGAKEFFLYGLLSYLTLSFGLRYFIPRSHRWGMAQIRQRNYREAIPYFQRSYEFFKRYSWIDKYRFLTLLSSSKMCYREMALINTAFCFIQIGDEKKGLEYYNHALIEYPNSDEARAGLNHLNGSKNKS